MREQALSILLLCDDRPGNANTIRDHIESFLRYSRHRIRTFNPIGMSRSLALDLGEFDVVVVHYTLVLSEERHVAQPFRDQLRRFRGLKVQFIQDEYRWVDRATAASREIGVGLLFTSAPEPAAGLLYDTRLPDAKRVHTLTGYVPADLARVPVKPLTERSLDVGYRGRDLPYWLGRLTQEKQWIAQGFQARAERYELRTDIGWREADRIYGDRWVEFIAGSRATLGTESGASIADFDGGVERAVRRHLRAHPGAPYEEVYAAVLEPYEGNVVVNVVSPRVFEAVSLGTALVMFPGHYSGVVEPGEHYIVLEKDFSNMDAVAAKLKDDALMAGLTQRASDHVVRSGSWSYESFIRDFDEQVALEASTARAGSTTPRHRLARLERSIRVPPLRVRATRTALAAASAVRGRDFSRRSEIEAGTWLTKGMLALREALGDPDLRPLLWEGRRAGIAIDSLLEEILEFSLLRRAARGNLATTDPFLVTAEYDRGARVLRFVSWPAQDAVPASDSPPADIDSRGVDVIQWDHRAVGGAVRLKSPVLDIGIGPGGVKDYQLLVQIGRRNPPVLHRALSILIGGGPGARLPARLS